MAFFPCSGNSSCMKIKTSGNTMTVEPILEGNPATDEWPYKNCTAGSANGLHCGPNGMWADPKFCTNYVEYLMEPATGSLSLDRTTANVDTDVTERLRIDNSSDDQFCNNSCYPVVAMIDVQWPWVSYSNADGVGFEAYGNADLPCATGKEFIKGSIDTTGGLSPSGSAASQGIVLSGGSRRFFCKLCPGECLGPIEMWVSAKITKVDEFKKVNNVCYIEDGEGDDFTVYYAQRDDNGAPVSQVINGDGTVAPPEVTTSTFDSGQIDFSHGRGQINIITMPDCNRTDCPC